MIAALFEIIFPVFGVIVIGMLARHFKIWSKEAVGGLNNYAYYIALPALIFTSIISLSTAQFLNKENLVMVLAVLAVHLIVCLTILLCTILLKRPRSTSAVAPMLSTFGSTAYLGIPFVTYLLGTEGAAYAALVSTILIAVLLFVDKLILNRYDALPSTKNSFFDLVELPFIWAMLLGIAWITFKIPPLPHAVSRLIEILAAGAGPTALLALGAFAYDTKIKEIPWLRVSLYAVVKTFALPLLIFLALSSLGISGTRLIVGVALAAVPTGITAFTLAEEHRVGARETEATILLSMILSLISLSVVSYIWLR